MKLQQTINLFLKEQQIRGNSKKTINTYSQQLRYFSEFVGDVDSFEIDYSIIQDYTIYLREKRKNSNHPYSSKTNKKLSDVTIQTYIRGVKVFIAFCLEENLMDQKSFNKIKLPKAKKVIIEILSDAEILKILYFCEKCSNDPKIVLRNKLIISLMLDCGLRANEVVTLSVSNIRFKENILKVLGKGNKERTVPFGNYTAKLLKKYISKYCSRNDLLLINEYGNPVGYNGIKKLFQKIRKYTKSERIHPHLLRHTFATKYLMNGGDTTSLKMILGHTSLKMVEHYLHLAEQFTINKYKKYCVIDNLESH